MALSRKAASGEAEMYPGQARYAKALYYGSRLTMAMLFIVFLVSISGLVEPQVAPEELELYWGQGVSEFLRHTGLPVRWGWLARLQHGDSLNLLAISLLAALPIPCLLSLLPIYLRRRDFPFVVILLGVVAVLVLAASGLLISGR